MDEVSTQTIIIFVVFGWCIVAALFAVWVALNKENKF